MIQIVIPRKNNEKELFYGEEKGFRKTKSGKYYYKNITDTSPENIDRLKSKFRNITFSLFFVEKGGAFPNDEDSFSQIICDFEGGKIFPIKKIREGNRANRIHAWFLSNDLCVINTYKENMQSKYRIMHYSIDKHTGVLQEELLYEGRLKHRNCMPKSLHRFNDAIEAASKKMGDYQCTRIYYSL